MNVHFTRPRDLLLAVLVGIAGGLLVFNFTYESLPPIPVLAGTTLLVLGLIELVMAFWVRKRVRTGRLTEAIQVARFVALAKASSLLGAIMGGMWLSGLTYLVPRSGTVSAAAGDIPAAVVGLVSALVLIGCALWLEHCCRTPEQDDHDQLGESPESRRRFPD